SDLVLTKDALYQLSYRGEPSTLIGNVKGGFE
ncbi:MAG: hypothetical protein RJA48_966, partial [Verrucomicrobiota bacterium]